jgi:mitochondrial ribonuclease P protein 1
LKQSDWDYICSLPSKSARRRHYLFMWKNQMKSENEKIKKEEKRKATAERLEQKRELDRQNEHIVYGLNYNSMFMRVYDATITKFQNSRLINSMTFGQKIVFDCSYDEFMNRQEASNTGKQLMISFAENRMNDQPFDIHFCNVNMQGISFDILKKFIPTCLDPDFPMNIHTESFTELFDKNRLVYLTPHCNNELKTFNHDDIYIIGAMVDKQNNDPISLGKAKKQGLRMAKLPLDQYLNWGAGSGKSLTLNQMISIMLEMKNSGDWNKALSIVPKRKIIDNEDLPLPRIFQDKRKYGYDNRNKNRFESENYNRHSDNERNDFVGFDKQRQFKEKKHFNKFKFDLQTWGSKMRKDS